eukprot:s464_g11.t5
MMDKKEEKEEEKEADAEAGAAPVPAAAGSGNLREDLKSEDPEVLRRAIGQALAGRQKDLGRETEIGRLGCRCHSWRMDALRKGRLCVDVIIVDPWMLWGKDEVDVIMVDPWMVWGKDEVVKAMQSVLDGTYRKVYTRDRRGAPIPDRFVEQNQNRVAQKYFQRNLQDMQSLNRQEKIRSKLNGEKPSLPDGSHTVNVLQKGGLGALPPLDSEVNEHWLFHGTTAEAATGIAENDFRLDLSGSNAGTLYGKGIYLAENATKSDEYGEGPKGPASTGEEAEMGYEAPRPPPGPPPPLVRTLWARSYILVCRSALGRVNYNDEQRPDPDKLVKSCTDGHFQSVLGDRLKLNKTFREIIVYNDDHVYPEFIVKEHDCELDVLQSMWQVYSMPNKGKISKSQLLDLLLAIYQPPDNEDDDLDQTFKEWDKTGNGKIDWDDFLSEVTQRVKDKISCSGPERFAEVYRHADRPELNEEGFQVVQQLGSGEAMIMNNAFSRFFKLCNVFFSLHHKEEDDSLTFHFPTKKELMYQAVRHNYPEMGDSILVARGHPQPFCGFAHGRRQKEPGLVSISLTLAVPTVADWVSVPIQSVITSARALMLWHINHPGMEEMRRLDQQFYVILTIHSWPRGRPFVPVSEQGAEDVEEVTTIDAGRRAGLPYWCRYQPRMVGSSTFLLSDYLMLFLERLGEHVDMHQSLDGQELQHYQCAVPDHEWQRVKDRFYGAYTLQKSAYRRANGGQAAPGMSEHAEPRFRTDRSLRVQQPLTLYRPVPITPRAPALVIHNTFLELEEPEELGTGAFKRTISRSASPRTFHNNLILVT